MNSVLVCDAAAPLQVFEALWNALTAEGPAVLVRDARATRLVGAGEAEITEVPVGTALVIQTSGSTGTPKSVALSAAALRASAAQAHERLGGPGQWLLALPLTYIAGMSVLVRSIDADQGPVLMPSGPFDARTFVKSAAELTAERRYTALVPVQLSRVIELAEEDPEATEVIRRFNGILIGGQALEADLRSRAHDLGFTVFETYGSSETAGGCVYNGVPLAGVEVEIDESGEILISGPQLATGYLLDDQRTADTFQNKNGKIWYHTGDAGVLDNGVLTVLGRRDRVIISGGLKVDLDAVEASVRRISDCFGALVIHIPDSEWGVRPAVVVPGEFSSEQQDALRGEVYDTIVAELGRVAAPKTVCFMSEIPRLSSGKPDLVALADYAAGQK
ncbi:O-succinylbenzoic acid--CoA ligase [Aurantimicrobium minutum]|uniref:AMP-binding protein n=1 Tax=Aurantimicrobium minutum TaxID=708131 RepID=UPI002476B1EF|nr:AMP-binding protein [Aurantimicrobium minutum]MDH6532201.1 O-succinylbenzoic acid--CoA ligase [Aurantimicrobium minutum]